MQLAILGASARAATFSALEAGYGVVAADLFADADLAERCPATKVETWPNGFADWLAEQEVDGWLYTGGLENYPELVDTMATIAPLLGNRGDVLRKIGSPKLLCDCLALAGCLMPETSDIAPGDSEVGWLKKSLRSCGGLEIERYESPSKHPQANDNKSAHYYQRWVAGLPVSAVYVAAGGECTLLGLTEQVIDRRWTHGGEFQYAGSIGPLEPDPDRDRMLVLAGETLARKFSLTGLFGIDFVMDAERKPWVIEVNPRYTASMELVEQITGLSMLATHVMACTRGELPASPVPKSTRGYGKAYLFAQRELTIKNCPTVAMADIPSVGRTIAAGQPIATVFAEASEKRDVEAELMNRVIALEKQLYADQDCEA